MVIAETKWLHRINSGAAKLSSYLMAMLLGLLAAWALWEVTTPIELTNERESEDRQIAASVADDSSRISLGATLFSLSGQNAWNREVVVKKAVEEPNKPVSSTLAVELVGTMVMPNGSGWALFLEKRGKREQLARRVGELISGATVEKIEPHQVVLRNGGRLEVVKLKMLYGEGGGAQQAAVESNREKPSQDRIRLRRNVKRNKYESAVSKGVGLLAGVNISPVYKGKEKVGYRLRVKKENAPLIEYGLQNGDVVERINGVSVIDPKAMGQMVSMLSKQSRVEVELSRGGNPTTLEFIVGR